MKLLIFSKIILLKFQSGAAHFQIGYVVTSLRSAKA